MPGLGDEETKPPASTAWKGEGKRGQMAARTPTPWPSSARAEGRMTAPGAAKGKGEHPPGQSSPPECQATPKMI